MRIEESVGCIYNEMKVVCGFLIYKFFILEVRLFRVFFVFLNNICVFLWKNSGFLIFV